MSRGHSLKLRKLAFSRDSGVCANCAADCEKIKRVYWAILDFEARCFYADRLGVVDEGRTFWEVDHVKELADGGTNDLDNLQTLCMWCHKVKTATWRHSRPFPAPVRAPKPTSQLPVGPALLTEGIRRQLTPEEMRDPYINVCGYLLYEKEPWLPDEMKGRLERAKAQLKVHDESFDVSDDYVSG